MQKLRGELGYWKWFFCRRMLKISYQRHISNEDILVGLNLRPQLMKMTTKRKCRYFGHIVRRERYEYQRLLLEGTVDSKRGRGRPNTWFSNIRDWMHATAVQKVQDWDQWRSMVSKVPDGYGTRDCKECELFKDYCCLIHVYFNR